MAAALTKIKGFIQTYSGYNFDNISGLEIEELRNFLSAAFHAVRWEIDTEFHQQSAEGAKIIYIKSLQAQLSHFCAGFDGFEDTSQTYIPDSEILDWVLKEIFKLLEYLKLFFPAYIDQTAELPVNFIDQNKIKQVKFLGDFKEKLTKHTISEVLKTILINFSEATWNSAKFVIRNWRQMDYLFLAMTIISNFLDDPPASDLDLELLKLFVGIDFNSIQVYSYFIKYIERITLSEAAFQEQQEQLLYLLKVFRQVRIDTPELYDPLVQSLKTSFVESLEAELNYLEQKEKLYLQNFKSTNPEAPSKFYFSVAVTLAELMFFFRIMLEVKLIFTKFNAYLYEFVSNHIKTARAENISKKSMRNLINNKPFPDRVVKNVKQWLQKMIEHIDLYYNF